MTEHLLNKLHSYLENPNSSKTNIELAQAYEEKGQLAAAFSFYLRAAEIEQTTNLAYECLIKLGILLGQIGTREHNVEGILLNAISLRIERPEAYFFLSICY